MSIRRTKCFHDLNIPLTREQFYSNGTEPQFKESWTHEELQEIAKKLKIRNHHLVDNYALFREIDAYFKIDEKIERTKERIDFQYYMLKKSYSEEDIKEVEKEIEKEEKYMSFLTSEKKKMVFQN